MKNEKENRFPVEVLHPDLQTIISESSKQFVISEDIIASAMLNVIGYSLLNEYELTINNSGWFERSNIWTLFIGFSGAGKSPLFNQLTKPVRKLDARLNKLYGNQMHNYITYKDAMKKGPLKDVNDLKELQEWVGKNLKDMHGNELAILPDEKPVKFDAYVESTTFEKINKILSDKYNDGRALMINYDEFAGFMNSLNQYSKGADEQTLLKLWGYSGLKVSRMDDANNWHVREQNVSLLGSTQPDSMFDIVNKQRILNGFPFRFLFVYDTESDKKLKNPFANKKFDANPLDDYFKMVDGFLETYEHQVIRQQLVLDEKGEEELYYLGKKYSNIGTATEFKSDIRDFGAIAGKMFSYIPRLAIIINRQRSYFDGEMDNLVLTKEDLVNASLIADYYIRNTVRVIDEVQFGINRNFKNDKEALFYYSLPNTFSFTQFVNEFMHRTGTTKSTAKDRLKYWCEESKLIRRNKLGHYYKTV